MKEFIAENWQFFISLCLSLIVILVSLLRKTKLINEVIDTPFERVLAILPRLIKEAEFGGKSGHQKKDYVVYAALSILQRIRDKDLTMQEIDDYSVRISDAVEQILETPQKKGVDYDKKEKN